MDSSLIKNILYEQIGQLTDAEIQTALASDNKKKTVEEILQKSIKQIIQIEDSSENLVIFAESLTHYLLTKTLTPSQRKISVDDTKVDVVIPDVKTLKKSPQSSLVLYFAKTNDIETVESLARLQKIQPEKENIWVISRSDMQIPYRTYDVVTNFAAMFDDIDRFLATKPQSKLKIFRV